MGKSNSKLKAEVLEELTRKTYCEYHRTVVTWYCCDGTRGAPGGETVQCLQIQYI